MDLKLKHKVAVVIVRVSSRAAFRGSTSGHAHYAASKAGLVALTVSLAREVAKSPNLEIRKSMADS